MATENRRVALPAGMRRVYGELDRAQVVMGLHNLARRVGILADSLLAAIPVPAAGAWDVRLIELYCAASEVILRVPGVASMLQTRTSWGKRTTSRPPQPFTSRRSRTRESPCSRGPYGVVHIPAGLGIPGRIALANPGRTRHPSRRGAVSQRARRDHRGYSGLGGMVTRVSSHAWIRSATLTQPGSSIMSWLILGYISASGVIRSCGCTDFRLRETNVIFGPQDQQRGGNQVRSG